jgi:hypothetical protein
VQRIGFSGEIKYIRIETWANLLAPLEFIPDLARHLRAKMFGKFESVPTSQNMPTVIGRLYLMSWMLLKHFQAIVGA